MGYRGKTVVVTIEARMASSRLPGKMMLPLPGGTVLSWVVRRCQAAAYVDEVVVASTVADSDQVLEDECRSLDVSCFRGSIDDITMRLLDATKKTSADFIIQVTGDCPLVDPRHIDQSIKALVDSDADYVTNNPDSRLPIGLDVRGVRRSSLIRSAEMTSDPIDRVHGTYHIARSPEVFKHVEWMPPEGITFNDVRLTLDEAADYQCIKSVILALKPSSVTFPVEELGPLFERLPELKSINAHVSQKNVAEG